jgi:beta-galactosidase
MFLIVLFILNVQYISAIVIQDQHRGSQAPARERLSLNSDWRFWRTENNTDGLIYDHRPDTANWNITTVLKPWVLPSGNDFIGDPSRWHASPVGYPGGDIPYVQSTFDDSAWESVILPHDWAIRGPFYTGENVPVKGGMGRLPVQGIGWYRRKLEYTSEDVGRQIYLDIDGAMSYSVVWLNGILVGGWPFGYSSFRLDLTPHLKLGGDNQLAIRLDNPTESSRWYPGGGIYRNVWLTKVERMHVAQWGTYITTKNVSTASATVNLVIQVENKGNSSHSIIEVVTSVYELDTSTGEAGALVVEFPHSTLAFTGAKKQNISQSVTIRNPRLWGPLPIQQPNLYVAATRLVIRNMTVDTYKTQFGIRSIEYSGDNGLSINGQHVRIQGVNQHHDLGALGTAFNARAAERQLEALRELGCNAIRMSHNPPAPELLQLTDQMGFVVIDEIFDMWQRNKTNSDFHLIFDDWYESDLRALIRRDRNHPSIIAWSVGNEVGEQYTNETGAALAQILVDIAHGEDPTRPVTASMNYAKPYMAFPHPFDILSLNYQGEGIRDAPSYAHLTGIKTPPLYADFHVAFPERMLLSSETAAALSTRGTYLFPVTDGNSAPVNDTSGGNSTSKQVSAYELYSADFGSSPDKVFAAQDRNPYVAGEFVWSGWDYLGEPTPYYSTRSSYFGIIDLAGFKKDRYFLYQSRWRPNLKMAHILPHWTWPNRVGMITPVHVFSAAEEMELFLNGESQGRKKKGEFEYRFRWDEIKYRPGELHVVAYKNGTEWATDTVRTAGAPTHLRLSADRVNFAADGEDISFVTVEVLDKDGIRAPEANNEVSFEVVSGAGVLVASDNGDPNDFVAFPSYKRKAFNGLALAIIKAEAPGTILVSATAAGLTLGQIELEAE